MNDWTGLGSYDLGTIQPGYPHGVNPARREDTEPEPEDEADDD